MEESFLFFRQRTPCTSVFGQSSAYLSVLLLPALLALVLFPLQNRIRASWKQVLQRSTTAPVVATTSNLPRASFNMSRTPVYFLSHGGVSEP